MNKIEIISLIVASVFNIAAIIVNAFGLTKVADVLYELLPFVNELVIAILALFGYQRFKASRA